MHLKHQAPSDTKGKGMGSKQRDLTKKAVLLSGPPGIGKTSSALIITRCSPKLHAYAMACMQLKQGFWCLPVCSGG